MGLATSLCLCLAAHTTAAQPVPPNPTLASKARAAQQTMEQLARLQEQARSTGAAADHLSQAGHDTLAAWLDYQQAHQPVREALQKAQDCLPGLHQRLEANNAAMAALAQAVARSHAAVQGMATAEGDGLGLASQVADAAFEQRQAAGKAFADQHRALTQQADLCTGQVGSAQWAMQRAQGRAQEVVDLARELAPQRTALRARWQATAQAFAAADQAGLLAPSGAALAHASDEQLKRLEQALAGTGLPERRHEQAGVQASALTPSRENLERLTTELERLQDAAAYIDLSTASASGDCENAHCAGLLADRHTLAARITDTQARLAQAVDQWQQSPSSLGERLAPLTTMQQSLFDRMQPLASTLGPAVTETTEAGREVQAAAARLQQAADTAFEQARLAWVRDYSLAYGKPPDLDLHNRPTSVGEMAVDLLSRLALMMEPEIRSHAYQLFSSFDGEIAGFGAYTYVLVRSASDLQTPAVRQRFEQLLRILQAQPAAGLVAGADKPHVNVFCIPVAPGNEDSRDAGEVVYASDLGQQIKMRTQNGLLTQKAVRQRLTSAPGPFLITVPGRLAGAQSGAPVLLADLSTYPPDAIADLTNHYMNGLVDEFPRQQALWKPPVLQRVALFMIHLAEGTGQLVTSALPTAQAQPR